MQFEELRHGQQGEPRSSSTSAALAVPMPSPSCLSLTSTTSAVLETQGDSAARNGECSTPFREDLSDETQQPVAPTSP